MAHDIARQFADEDHDRAVDMIAGHIRRFWAPPMIARLRAQRDGGADLDPLVDAVVARLADERA